MITLIPTNFKYLNFPQVPQDLIDSVYKCLNEQHDINSTHTFKKFKIDAYQIDKIEETYTIDNTLLGVAGDEAVEQYPNLSTFVFTKAPEEVRQWCCDNILKDCTVHIQYFTSGNFFLPHVDLIRNRAYNYLIETGDALTCFWRAKNEYAHLQATPNTFIPYDRIELVEEINIEKNRWHQLSVDNIHSVEKIKSNRLSLTISLVDNPSS